MAPHGAAASDLVLVDAQRESLERRPQLVRPARRGILLDRLVAAVERPAEVDRGRARGGQLRSRTRQLGTQSTAVSARERRAAWAIPMAAAMPIAGAPRSRARGSPYTARPWSRSADRRARPAAASGRASRPRRPRAGSRRRAPAPAECRRGVPAGSVWGAGAWWLLPKWHCLPVPLGHGADGARRLRVRSTGFGHVAPRTRATWPSAAARLKGHGRIRSSGQVALRGSATWTHPRRPPASPPIRRPTQPPRGPA